MSPKMSYGVLQCDIVMLQNYMPVSYTHLTLPTIILPTTLKQVLLLPDPVYLYISFTEI